LTQHVAYCCIKTDVQILWKEPMGKQKKLSTEIDIALARLGRKQKWLANVIGGNFNTFRSHMARNQFYCEEAEAICAALQLPLGSGIRTQYDFTLLAGEPRYVNEHSDDLCGMFQKMDRLTIHVQRACKPIRESYLATIGMLDKYDLNLVFSATVTPMEMELNRYGGEIRAMIAQSIKRGGTFVYFRPEKNVISKFSTTFRLREVIPFEQQQLEFETFRAELQELLERDRSAKDAKELVMKHTLQVYPIRCPFWSPGTSFGLLRTFDPDGQEVNQVSIRLPDDVLFISWNNEFTAARMVSTAEAIFRGIMDNSNNRAPAKPDEKAVIAHARFCLREYLPKQRRSTAKGE
jgi:hypothetical protein